MPIRGDLIRLGQLLKLAGMIDSGAQVKAFLSAQPVFVNGDLETRRGRQLHVGDVITIGVAQLRLTSAAPPPPPPPPLS